MIQDIGFIRGTRDHIRECLSFPDDAIAGFVPCLECRGTGWWDYGPTPETNGACIDCKGQGRVLVGLL